MREIAEALFMSGAIHFAADCETSPLAPIYCDVRAALGNVTARTLISGRLADLIAAEFPGCGALVGVATGGIPFSAIAAHTLGLPCGYARVQKKDRGLAKLVEGNLATDTHCVIVEDCMVLGNSAASAVAAVRDYGCVVSGVVGIVTYGSHAAERAMSKLGVKMLSLTCINELVGLCLENNTISELQADRICRYARGRERKI